MTTFASALRPAFLCALALLGTLGVACSDQTPAAIVPTPTVTPTATTTVPPAAPRALSSAPPMPAAPENLVLDPDFEGALTYTENPDGFGIYTVFPDHVTMRVRFEATTPVGPGMPVLYVKGKGNGGLALSAQGGSGPFDASVWVGSADEAATAALSLVSYPEGSEYVLVRDEQKQVHGALTWTHYAARIEAAVPGVAYFALVVPNGKELALAGPELLGHAAPGKRILRMQRVAPRPALRSTLAQLEAAERLKAEHLIRTMPRPRHPTPTAALPFTGAQ